MRIFIGPVEIAGIAQGLKKGFRDIGIAAETFFSVRHPFGYSATEAEPQVIHIWQTLGRWRSAFQSGVRFERILFSALVRAWSFIVLFWAIRKFDCFIYLYGCTFTNTAFELWLLRTLRRKIIFIYAGSDSRPPYMDGGCFAGSVLDPIPPARLVYKLVCQSRRRVGLQQRYADYVVCSPASGQFLSRPYIDWFSMGIPKAFQSTVQVSREAGKVLRILHAPSNPLVKGTSIILAALESLSRKGYAIEVVQIQNKSNSEVIEALESCDFIVDQLYSDTPLAAFATEAAFFGKPAVVAGYFASDLNENLSAEDIPPSLFVLPEDIQHALERMIVDADFRCGLGLRAQRFVMDRWSPAEVATRYLRLIEGKAIPSKWWRDPLSITYSSGCGLDRARVGRLVKGLLDDYGMAALGLADKPVIEKALVDLAHSSTTEPRDA